MWRNYLKIALRNLWGHKVYSLINVFGLALGMAVCMLILRYVAHERSYDRMHEQADRIYRITHQRDLNGTFENQATTPLALRDALLADFPEVAHAVRFLREIDPVIEQGDEQFVE
jgi:putative ABC transport system permease protein